MDRAAAAATDAQDPLAALRSRFVLPDGVIYLDGNSLGPLQPAVARAVEETTVTDWGRGLIGSWNRTARGPGWVGLARRIAVDVARLIGADPGEVAVGDSTSVDLFKVLVAMARLRPDRGVILVEEEDFPTDRYVAAEVADLLGRELRVVPRDALPHVIDDDVAVVSLTEVDYRTGARHDAAALTGAAHDAGALAVWDLSHSTGALEVDVHRWNADAAVGCTYKYLNGGPGSPAYVFVARRHLGVARTPIAGWFGHAEPFAFADAYHPASDAARFQAGTPPVLALAALETALEVQRGVDPSARTAKVRGLTQRFIDLVDARTAGLGLEVVTPREPAARGAQVSLRHPAAYPVVRALADRGVVGDHRPPDLLRFGFSPLYVRHVDVWDAVDVLVDVLETEAWRRGRYQERDEVV